MKINLLKSEVYNQIAAGEVVEKPFNVVKELVENSIDAGASEIKIEIENGGIDLIRITDNGCGIEKSQIPNAFAPHATSKINDINDLEKILTLGFRGEALASIASVSKINLKTKTKDALIGTETTNLGGNISAMCDVGLFNGTVIEIKDLFYNIPARKKFLKKPKLEEADITDFVERLILSHPDISFNYFVNGKEIYNYKCSNLENAIYTIYGKEVFENIIPISFNKSKENGDEIRLSGFIGKPNIAKGNKKDQSLFINGRYVKNQTVYSAVGRVFENYLMKGKYPFYVLNLSISPNLIDINVHPTKQEIRFEDNAEIFNLVYHATSNAILNATKINLDDALSSDQTIRTEAKSAINDATTPQIPAFKSEASVKSNSLFDLFKNISNEKVSVAQSTDFENISTNNLSAKLIDANKEDVFSKNIENAFTKTTEKEGIFESEFRIIGSLFKTYLLIEEGDKFYLIDQHAAHERLLYDKLIETTNVISKRPMQQLLVPYIKTLTHAQNEIMQESLSKLKSIGFDFEEFGKNTYKLNQIPTILTDVNLDDFLEVIFENSAIIGNLKSSELVKDKLASYACKSAVKAGATLSNSEINQLISSLKKNDTVLLCPHGRPIIVTYTKKDIEKWFKRIV